MLLSSAPKALPRTLRFALAIAGGIFLALTLESDRTLAAGEPPDTSGLATLRVEIQELELRAQKLKLEKELLQGILPGSDFKSVEGKITASDTIAIESDVLLFACLKNLASQIGGRVRPALSGSQTPLVVIFTPDLTAQATELASFLTCAGYLIETGRSALAPAPPPKFMPPGISGVAPVTVLKGVGEILQLLQSEVTLAARRYVVEERSLQWLVAKELGEGIVFPPLGLPSIDALNSDKGSVTLRRLATLRQVSDSLGVRLTAIDSLLSRLAAGSAEGSKPGAADSRKQLEFEALRYRPVKVEIDRVIELYLKVDTATGLNRLSRISRFETLFGGTSKPLLLTVEVTSGTAARELSRNAFAGSHLRMAGRLEGRFALTTPDGRILATDVLAATTRYVQIREIVKKGKAVGQFMP